MFRALTAFRPLACTLLPFKYSNSADDITPEQGELLYGDNSVTGFDRIKAMFSLDEFDGISYELAYILRSTMLAGFGGGMYGGFVNSRAAYIKFMETHHGNLYDNNFDAKKVLQDKVTLAFGKGAWKWGWRLAIFTTSYVFLTTTIQVYRGKSSILEYMIGGTVSGALYKASHGLRGMTVGSAVGFTLGTTLGGLTLLILNMTNTSIEDVRFWNHKWKESRKKKWGEIIDQSSSEKHDEMTVRHDLTVNRRLDLLNEEEKK